ncbi:hypothetical protein GCM10028806_44570 [Spirosoma terrae]|uniref:Antitoxin n=1 Tax=Spirosoma terrae TaxID=1968276 RepID=A0A6L9L039_9BACT|nr:antitoxin [Spirosoma terrae]NDU93875.1 antitoxin [Spirosoma terrae]
MTVVSVELEDKLAVELKEAAELLKTDEVELIRKAVTNYIRQYRMDRIREGAQPYADQAGFLTEDDIYREIS